MVARHPLVSGLVVSVALIGACTVQSETEFRLLYQYDGGEALTCDEADVATVIFTIFEDGSATRASSRITLPCSRSDDQIFDIEPGNRSVQIEGLNADGVVCYADLRTIDFGRRESHIVRWTVVQRPGAEDEGCAFF